MQWLFFLTVVRLRGDGRFKAWFFIQCFLQVPVCMYQSPSLSPSLSQFLFCVSFSFLSADISVSFPFLEHEDGQTLGRKEVKLREREANTEALGFIYTRSDTKLRESPQLLLAQALLLLKLCDTHKIFGKNSQLAVLLLLSLYNSYRFICFLNGFLYSTIHRCFLILLLLWELKAYSFSHNVCMKKLMDG